MNKAIEAIMSGRRVPKASYTKIVSLYKRSLHDKQLPSKDLIMARQAINIVKAGLFTIQSQEIIDLKLFKQLSDINVMIYQAYWNRNGIQALNIENNGGLEGAKCEKMKPLKNLANEFKELKELL